ncbi:MAG: zinc ABC transporter substrate-binding protein [Defluviimonas denitrificans]
MAEVLAGADPDNAATYRANAEKAAKDIVDLDTSLKERTGALTKSIVVSHDAYGYLAEHYGLTIAGSLSEGDAARPGAARVSELRQLLDSGNVACVFPRRVTIRNRWRS